MNPATCIVDGTKVTLSGSGFTPGADGTFLQCNTDSSQPNNSIEGGIPDSCTSPFDKVHGPGVVNISPSGQIEIIGQPTAPITFTIDTGPVGPPCAPNSCTGTTDTPGGGNPFTDAAKYPCGPPGAFPDDNCEILFGDSPGNDPSITIPITFNPNTPPPPATTPTAGSTATTAPKTAAKTASKTAATKATSGSLAFTGAGPGLWWLALVGAVLMALGIFALVLVDQPRRLVRAVAGRVTRRKPNSP